MVQYDQYLEIRFSGTGVHPETIHSKELAEVIAAFEEMMSAELTRSDKEIDSAGVVVSLVGIEEGSAKLRFRSTYMTAAVLVFSAAAQLIEARRYEELAPKSVESLKTFQKFGRKHNSYAEFRTEIDSPEPLARLAPEDAIELEGPEFISGETAIYGRVVRVGGVEPKIWLSVDGDQVGCDANETLAKKAAVRLYETIGLQGSVRWKADDMSIDSFRALRLLKYEDTSIVDSFGELSNMVSEYYEDVEDVERYVAGIRGETSEDG